MTVAVDTNVLVYAHRTDSPFHEIAKQRVTELAVGAAPWALPWPCVYEFFSVVTHPRIYAPPTPQARALDQLDAWLESPSLVLLTEDAQHWPALRALLAASLTVGPRTHDARIASLCIANRVTTLWTADRDFSRFPQLRSINPLVG